MMEGRCNRENDIYTLFADIFLEDDPWRLWIWAIACVSSDKMGTGIQNRTRDDRIEQLEEFVIPRFSRLGEFLDGKKKDKIGMVK